MKNKNYIQLKSKTELSGFYIVYYGSTIYEYMFNSIPKGISHLMEHLLTKRYDEFLNDFDKDGINWNAYTDNNLIIFYMTGLEEQVNKYKKIFYEKVSKFDITQKELDNEKKIVLEEYKDAFNNQSESHILNLYRKYYNYYFPIGSRQDIERITLKDCKEHFKRQFEIPNRIIDITKKHDNTISKYFNLLKYKETNYPVMSQIWKLNPYNTNLELLNEFKEKTSIVMISDIIENDYLQSAFINYMLSYGLQSPLYNEIREKNGLVYYIRMSNMMLGYDKVQIIISTETSNENAKEVINRIQKILNNPKKYMTKERFDLVKNMLMISKKKIEAEKYLQGDLYSLPNKFNIYNFLTSISYNDVLRVYDKYFKPKKWFVSNDRQEFNRK